MDYVDLYQIHRWDPRTPIEETMEALHDVVRMGKARYIGASSMFAWQFAQAQHAADLQHWTRFVSMQPHYNLLYREQEREMIPYCIDQGVGVIPWSPLARGVLAGNRNRDGEKLTARSDTDALRRLPLRPADRLRRRRTGGGGGRPASGCRRHRSRLRGSSASPVSPHRSSAPPSRNTSPMRWRPSSSISVTRRSRRSGRALRPPPGGRTLLTMSADPSAVDFHFDIMCPYAYQTSLWMREVRDTAGVDGAVAVLQPRGDQPPGREEARLGARVDLRLVDDADRRLPSPFLDGSPRSVVRDGRDGHSTSRDGSRTAPRSPRSSSPKWASTPAR